ncbi:hypothetical protein EJV47_27280 [Hymenobacter gummosus]|uniref:Uncharacterized protein n=1 Tax=Hymenobacter gummosus TaxID=1776032 RepID=A0A431TUM6_9BACT|nr:hypothetical protein [Hymenobacter gummosus]RTQ44909.1 hypothetical protein EJV47_27280 [Hymenobacter gummosus]
MTTTLRLAALLLLATACRPDDPATEQSAPEQAAPAADSTPAAAVPPAAARPAAPADTLHLPGGLLVQLRPVTAAAFARLPASRLPDVANDLSAERFDATGGRVRRQGLDLLLQPAQGPLVRLSSTPDAQFAIENGDAVRYQYQGSLPAARQWVVRAWYWESAGTVLVDQRTGRRLELLGDPAPSPDGRLLLLTSRGLSGGEQPNVLGLVRIDADGPQQLWQREPTSWEPDEARWAASNRVVLQVRRPDADGAITDETPVHYAELTLPATR